MKLLKPFLILITLIVVGCKDEPNKKNPKESPIIVNINSGDRVTSPLNLEVNANGNWKAFEGELGSVKLLNDNNEELTTGILVSTNGDWMTNENAIFSTLLSFGNDKEQNGKLVFQNKVISEEEGDVQETFEIAVIIMPTNISN